ncbi:MAG: SufS family cysteine desulfurase, partial [Candidatus Thermoplasmatota archaeon]|nr:SufS family cysteine desulfurase [Candidatus Thermoplasmatota archaeon]
MPMDLGAFEIEKDFPVLERKLRGDRRLVYLDSAATSQRPNQVVEAVRRSYQEHNANVHRGIHQLAEEATAAYEEAHTRVAQFVGAGSMENVAFTKNCTEAINTVAYGWALRNLEEGDEILTTQMEHHANIVPWQEMAKLTGATVRYVPITDDHRLDVDAYDEMLSPATKLVTFSHVSNVLGTINPVHELTEKAKDQGARVLIDAAQSVPHMPVDFDAIGADWMAFSGHKMLAPTGIGALVGTDEAFEATYPAMFGGEMISRVTFEGSEWAKVPWRFEAGTPVIGEAAGLMAAVAYLERLGMENVKAHSDALVAKTLTALEEIGCETYGPAPEHRSSVVSFNVPGIHAHDLASLVDDHGVAIRAGHHCAMPLMGVLGLPATARASFYIYNKEE